MEQFASRSGQFSNGGNLQKEAEWSSVKYVWSKGSLVPGCFLADVSLPRLGNIISVGREKGFEECYLTKVGVDNLNCPFRLSVSVIFVIFN